MNKVKLGDIVKIYNGKAHQSLKKVGITPVFGSGGLMGYTNDFIYEGEAILLPRKGTLSNIQYLNEKFWVVDTTYYAVVDKEKADTYFIWNYLKLLNLENLNSGSAVPSMTQKAYQDIEINLPSLSTQSAIARILSSLDDKIELNNKINKELENLARTIYDYWFVQKEIPKKWKNEKIANLIKSEKSGDWGKETKQGKYTEKVICIRGTDINSFAGNDEIKAPERYILEKNKNKFLVDGDIVIEISGGSPTQSTGRMAYILDEILEGFENPLICSNFCKVISLKDRDLYYYFIFTWKQLYENGVFFGYEGKTSGIKNFLFDNFVNSYEMIIPPTHMLRQFRETISPIFSKIVKNRQESANLAQLRDFLLPLLMSGEVGVG